MSLYVIPTYAAFPYYKKGTADTDEKKRVQRILYALKDGGEVVDITSGKTYSATDRFCQAIATETKMNSRQNIFFNSSVALVPIPSSTGLGMRAASQWPCLQIAQHLETAGLGTAIPAVTRKAPIPTSHKVSSDEKPDVATVVNSIEVDLSVVQHHTSITLIDDVVSSGTNAVGVMVALKRAGYMGRVTLFAAAWLVGRDGPQDGPFFGECVWHSERPRAYRRT